ncbi:MAG: AsnC family transcriptional regulator, partial [Candidatus Thermoplasmatota archaeon]|nr:AsnC family transcriptional regulator [Candidatus Thermoplasmatota archaeon]
MSLNLDDVDRKILRELQQDGRASFRDISARI